jgi:hypothetical protein
MRLSERISVAALIVVAIPALSSSQVGTTPGQFVSAACGFRVQLPADWKIRPSRSKKCEFTVIAPHRADGDIELTVRNGTLEDGAEKLGFAKDNGKWILQGEGSAGAVQIESATWVGLQGSVATRVYEKGTYSGLGDQTRAVLFDREHRIAEITCYVGDKVIPEFVKSFEFLAETRH